MDFGHLLPIHENESKQNLDKYGKNQTFYIK
jgi:hypothetical protein